jgi:hypothetical protein
MKKSKINKIVIFTQPAKGGESKKGGRRKAEGGMNPITNYEYSKKV